MLALGTQAQGSAPGGPYYSVSCVHVELCQRDILCHRILDVVCVHVPYVAVFINATAQYQGHLHHHSVSHTNTRAHSHTHS